MEFANLRRSLPTRERIDLLKENIRKLTVLRAAKSKSSGFAAAELEFQIRALNVKCDSIALDR